MAFYRERTEAIPKGQREPDCYRDAEGVCVCISVVCVSWKHLVTEKDDLAEVGREQKKGGVCVSVCDLCTWCVHTWVCILEERERHCVFKNTKCPQCHAECQTVALRYCSSAKSRSGLAWPEERSCDRLSVSENSMCGLCLCSQRLASFCSRAKE